MPTVTIALPDEPMLRLQELAKEAGVAPEELLRASVEHWLAKPKEDFAQAASYVLKKNAELYRQVDVQAA
jgi:predicted DNA-binding protein